MNIFPYYVVVNRPRFNVVTSIRAVLSGIFKRVVLNQNTTEPSLVSITVIKFLPKAGSELQAQGYTYRNYDLGLGISNVIVMGRA